MSDSRDAISKLIITYAERVDMGDFEGVGALFEHSTYRSALGDDVVTYNGAEDVQKTMETMVRRYDDGTPRTKHVTTNLMIDVDDGAGTATAKSMVLNIVLVHIIGMLGTLVFWGANPRAPIGG